MLGQLVNPEFKGDLRTSSDQFIKLMNLLQLKTVSKSTFNLSKLGFIFIDITPHAHTPNVHTPTFTSFYFSKAKYPLCPHANVKK